MLRAAGAALGSTVHAELELIDFAAHSGSAQSLLRGAELFGQENLDGIILEEPVWSSSEINSVIGSDLEGFFEAGRCFRVPWVAAISDAADDFVDLGRERRSEHHDEQDPATV